MFYRHRRGEAPTSLPELGSSWLNKVEDSGTISAKKMELTPDLGSLVPVGAPTLPKELGCFRGFRVF